MMRLGFLCPGQGSQEVGMGRALMAREPLISEMLSEAGERMEMDLLRAVKKGPSRVLTSTRVAQVAIYVFSAGIGRILARDGIEPTVTAGHSLGQISALQIAGALSYDDALDLVIARANAMELANSISHGSMSAVLGDVPEDLGAICDRNGIWVANYNTPGQTVISGGVDGLSAAEEDLKALGLRVKRLQVAGAYHSGLMEAALPAFEEALAKCEFDTPKLPVLSNVSGGILGPSSNLREELLSQVTAPVLWRNCVDGMKELGIDAFVEVGFGKHMKGLALQNQPDLKCYTSSSPKEIDTILNVAKTVEAS